MKKEKTTDEKLISRLFFRLLPFQMLLIAINAVNGIVDSLYASNVIGEKAMSAMGLYGPFNHFLYAAGIMLVGGSQILYGRYISKNHEEIQSIFSVDLAVTALLSVATSLILVFAAAAGLTGGFVQEEEIRQMLNQYIYGQAIGIPALLVGQQLFAFLSLENRTKLTMAASISCLVVNAVMDHLLVVVFDMGIFGLAFASAISVWAFLIVQATHYLRGRSEWKFSFRACRWHDAPMILKLGYPGSLSRFVEMFRCLIVNALILRYVGSVGLSSFAASNSLLAVFWAGPFGMMAVSRMLFSVSLGEEDRASLIEAMHVVCTKGVLVIFGMAAALSLSAIPLTNLYFHDPSNPVYHMTVMGFRLLPLCMPLSVVSLNFACYAQAAEKKTLSVILPIVDGAVGVVCCSFFLIPLMKMNGLYLANILNGFICILVVIVYAWIVRGRRPESLADLMVIPDSFGAPENERMDMTVREIDEVTDISVHVIDFCLSRGIDRRRAFFAGLCLEEMAGNVVLHGFTKDRKTHSLELRVVHSGDAVILRLRDDCPPFDPTGHSKIMEADESFKNVGIRLVFRIADDVRYQNLLGLNVLTMRI